MSGDNCGRAHFYIGNLPPAPTWPTRAPVPSIAEQMGTDPISKLARAIHDLADAMRSVGDGGSVGIGDGGSGI